MGMGILGKVRYAKDLKFEHPYKPWADDHNGETHTCNPSTT